MLLHAPTSSGNVVKRILQRDTDTAFDTVSRRLFSLYAWTLSSATQSTGRMQRGVDISLCDRQNSVPCMLDVKKKWFGSVA